MSGASQALGRQMSGARDLSAVVRSMKVLAASSIIQYERSVDALTDYYRTIELGLSVCLRETDSAPLTAGRSISRRRVAIIFGSDQGLVGRFNEVLIEHVQGVFNDRPGDLPTVYTIGERMLGLVTDAGLTTAFNYAVPLSIDGITPLIGQILLAIEAELAREELCEIHVFHNQPLAAAAYRPVGKRMLPLDASWVHDLSRQPWPGSLLPEIIGNVTLNLAAFLRGYLFVLLFQACAQSLAGENASRLAAMQRAEENIAQRLSELTRRYHRLRQASIDEELFDVVSGYEAAATGTREAGFAPAIGDSG